MLGDSVRRRQPRRREQPTGKGSRWSGRLKPLLLLLPLAVLVPFAVGYMLAVFVLFPPLPAAGDAIAVPDMIGHSTAEAQRLLAASGLGPLDVTELPHPTAPAGTIVAQTPLPGQQLRPGVSATVAVSMGRPRVMVPDVRGFGADRAESLLRRAGFDVARTDEESTVAADHVIRTEPEPAQERTLPAVVTMVISTGPAPVDPDTLFHDTLPGYPPRREQR
jgi:eukaryotic-like serine/threonine-protein kinase